MKVDRMCVIRSWGLQESEGSNMGLTLLFHKYLF